MINVKSGRVIRKVMVYLRFMRLCRLPRLFDPLVRCRCARALACPLTGGQCMGTLTSRLYPAATIGLSPSALSMLLVALE
jgi:hypothetical protein